MFNHRAACGSYPSILALVRNLITPKYDHDAPPPCIAHDRSNITPGGKSKTHEQKEILEVMVTSSKSLHSRQLVPTVITETSTIDQWNNPTSTTPVQPPSTYWPQDFRWVQDRKPGDPFIPGTILPKERHLPSARRESDLTTSVISAYVFPTYQDPSPHPPNPTQECTETSCPLVRVLKIPHQQGHYFHRGSPPMMGGEQSMFGTSDPPPEVWAAYERLREGDGKEDMDMVIPFAYYHFGWPDDRFDEGIEVRGWTRFTRAFRQEYRRVFRAKAQPANRAGKSGWRTFCCNI